MTTTNVPGIYAKLAKIQDEVGTIPKNGRGPSSKGGYEYVKFDDVVQKVRDLFVVEGIVSTIETLEHNVRIEQVNNRMVVNTSIRVKYTYTDIADGSSVFSIAAGEGSDIGGDTATRKAFTQALKIVLLQTFNIVTGEDVDTDGAEKQEIPAAKPVAGAAPVANAAVDSVDSIRADIAGLIAGTYVDPASGEILDAFPGGGAAVNKLANELTKKKPDDWGKSAADLKKVREKLIADLKG